MTDWEKGTVKVTNENQKEDRKPRVTVLKATLTLAATQRQEAIELATKAFNIAFGGSRWKFTDEAGSTDLRLEEDDGAVWLVHLEAEELLAEESAP